MNKIPLPTIVLFDMDGTTVRHVQPWILNVLERIDDVFYKTSRFFARLRRGREMIDFSDVPATQKRLLVHRALHKVRRKEVDQIVQPCPGVLPLLNFFKKQGIPMALVSNGLGEGYGHEIVQAFDLGRYFDAYVFREDAEKSKPHPDSLLRALKMLKEDPIKDDVVWFIGDRQKDIAAAIAAEKFLDCDFVPFAYGLHAAVAILKNNISTDHIIMDYTDFSLRVAEMFEDSKDGKDSKDSKDSKENKNADKKGKTKPYRNASKSVS